MATEVKKYEKVKEFKFRVEVNGFPVALVEECDMGEEQISVVKSAGAGQNHPDKEAGGLEYGDCVLRTLVPTEGPGIDFWNNAIKRAQNPATQSGLHPSGYYFEMTVLELDNTSAPVRITEFHNCFVNVNHPTNRSGLSFDKNAIDEIHIAYEWREQRAVNGG